MGLVLACESGDWKAIQAAPYLPLEEMSVIRHTQARTCGTRPASGALPRVLMGRSGGSGGMPTNPACAHLVLAPMRASASKGHTEANYVSRSHDR